MSNQSQNPPIHQMCQEHLALKVELENLKSQIIEFKKKLDWMTAILIVIAIESGISLPLMV